MGKSGDVVRINWRGESARARRSGKKPSTKRKHTLSVKWEEVKQELRASARPVSNGGAGNKAAKMASHMGSRDLLQAHGKLYHRSKEQIN
jgi:hypothetical protein